MGRILNSTVRSQRLRSLLVRHGLPLFLGVVVWPASWQDPLTSQLKEQDRGLTPPRDHALQAHVADLGTAHFTTTLDNWDDRISEPDMLASGDTLKTKPPESETLTPLIRASVGQPTG
jgi:hypothetical protein